MQAASAELSSNRPNPTRSETQVGLVSRDPLDANNLLLR